MASALIRASLQRTKRDVAALEMDAEPATDATGDPAKLDEDAGSTAQAGRRKSGRKAKKAATQAKSQG